jgi:hypothetical protein
METLPPEKDETRGANRSMNLPTGGTPPIDRWDIAIQPKRRRYDPPQKDSWHSLKSAEDSAKVPRRPRGTFALALA